MLSDNFDVWSLSVEGNHEAIGGETWVIIADQGLISRGHPVDFHAPPGKLQQTGQAKNIGKTCLWNYFPHKQIGRSGREVNNRVVR